MIQWILLLTTILISSCGFSDHAGGSGMEIPNSVTMISLLSDGSPAINARVKLVAESKWLNNYATGKSVILDSTSTDKNGAFSIEIPQNETFRIEIISEEEGVSILFDSEISTIELTALGSIYAKCEPNAMLSIKGTSFKQQADPDGNIFISGIPSLNSFFVSQNKDSIPVIFNTFQLNPSSDLELGSLNALVDSLIIDDFEGSIKTTQLSSFVQGSYWYSNADENQGGNSIIIPSTANQDDWSIAVSDSSAFEGSSLTIRYQMDSTYNNAYALFGCSFRNGINGRAIDSIKFVANTDAGFILSSNAYTLFQGPPTIGWEQFTVHRSKLDSLEVNLKIENLQFSFTDTNGNIFRLDNFIIYGNPFDLLLIE